MKAVRILGMLVAALSIAAVLACGPSFQAIYEGNARFEHCYALEENAQTMLTEKADCWHDWSTRYTFGQTRDRIHYATARYVALSQVVPTDEAMMMAAPGMTPRQSTITAPNPTNAFAPPPKVLEEVPDASAAKAPRPSERPVVVGSGPPNVDAGVDGGAAPAAAPAPPSASGRAAPPGAACAAACATAFHACTGGTCDKAHRSCMRDCFK